MERRIKRTDEPAVTKTRARPASRRRRVLLAMGVPNPPRERGIVRFAREKGWILDSSLHYYHALGEDLNYLDIQQYDGVLSGAERSAPWLPPLLKHFRVPVVEMWADFPGEPYPRVLVDNRRIGQVAVEHLRACGCVNFLFYTHAIEGISAVGRREGFELACREAEVEHHVITWDHRTDPRGRQARLAWLGKWLSKARLPLGIVGSKDPTASEALDAAMGVGLAVPRQVAVVGVDNDPAFTELSVVPLTSVDSARERAGYEAASLLDRLMSGDAAPTEPILVPPGPVVARRSTDVWAVRDSDVAMALQFIQEHYHEPIAVDDVADQAGISRRSLQNRVLAETGQTVHEMILRQRMKSARELLVTTRAKIQSVAERSGFRTGENLCKVFRRRMGVSPERYREQYTVA